MRFTIDNQQKILKEYLLPIIKFPLDCKDNWLMFEKTFPQAIKIYNATVDNLVLESTDSNVKRNEAISHFMNIMYGGAFEKPFYTFGDLSTEFDYIRYFIVNKDYEAMETILYSASPTSRLLIAKTIEYMKKHYKYIPSSKINSRIKEVLAGNQTIEGGIVSCWINKFDYDKYDIGNNFTNYLISK